MKPQQMDRRIQPIEVGPRASSGTPGTGADP
jgi:hypothetical protein